MGRQPSPSCHAASATGGNGIGRRFRTAPSANRTAAPSANATPGSLLAPGAGASAPSRTPIPARPSASAAKPREVGRVPRSSQANKVAQIGIVKTSNAPSPTVSHLRQRAEKPIQAKTLVRAARASRGANRGATARRSTRPHATTVSRVAATSPARPRENSGVHVCRTSFIASQPRPQPSAVTSSARTPSVRDEINASAWATGSPGGRLSMVA